jgi:DNA mismatch repair protein MutS
MSQTHATPAPLPPTVSASAGAAALAAALPDPADPSLTPMMSHYLEVKRQHPDCLLFYRMGDFYEMFFADAEQAARALDITLTKRGKYQEQDIPMAGVPVHAAEAYLSRLIRQGIRVAVAEQMEDPAEARKRGGKSMVRRDVVRILTPGTLTEDGLLDARRHNWLAAITEAAGQMALAALDVSTGQVQAGPVRAGGLAAALQRLEPSEILVPERLLQQESLFEVFADWKRQLTPLPTVRFDPDNARRRLEAAYGVGTLDGFGAFSRAETAATGTLIDYVDLTQRGRLPRLSPPVRLGESGTLEIDAATARSLELTRTQAGERRGSLLAVLDRSVTGGGARLLHHWLVSPLTDLAAIRARQAMVGFFADRHGLRGALRDRLKAAPDLERPLSRLSLGRGGPRDLAAIRDGLAAAADLRVMLTAPDLKPLPPLLAETLDLLRPETGLIERLGRALLPELPLLARDGGFIAADYAPDLDHFRSLKEDARRHIAALQARYAADTGISTLKIKHNNIIGYFIEVTSAHADKLMGTFIHRQTMAGAARFSTVELATLESDVAKAGERALALEQKLFEDLAGEVMARAEVVAGAARGLAMLDVVAGLADLAVDADWCCPQLTDDMALEIRGGRHPVVEAMLPDGRGAFVANDCTLTDRRLWLLTGPNMAGKSTFLRQNALIVLLAQMGSYVPAAAARIGVVDRLFSRVGAADDLARGRSTFMVEMVETAAILNNATPRSLVILDEIGRGTATFDGLSIAWAAVEHLVAVNRCRALFATHYHELTALSGRFDQVACHSMRVKEWQGTVVFMHEVAAGAADRSYGIHVARLAGLPAAALARAEEVLKLLESGEQSGALARLADDLPLFAATLRRTEAAVPPPSPADSALAAALAALDPDALSPREALEALYRLKSLL